ncbi:hypothetical protein BTHE_1997 [Bifidobacterium thermophilum]|nr:hypothetical protein BTHE_1997 [Bifidobacterium thermophilum]
MRHRPAHLCRPASLRHPNRLRRLPWPRRFDPHQAIQTVPSPLTPPTFPAFPAFRRCLRSRQYPCAPLDRNRISRHSPMRQTLPDQRRQNVLQTR